MQWLTEGQDYAVYVPSHSYILVGLQFQITQEISQVPAYFRQERKGSTRNGKNNNKQIINQKENSEIYCLGDLSDVQFMTRAFIFFVIFNNRLWFSWTKKKERNILWLDKYFKYLAQFEDTEVEVDPTLPNKAHFAQEEINIPQVNWENTIQNEQLN